MAVEILQVNDLFTELIYADTGREQRFRAAMASGEAIEIDRTKRRAYILDMREEVIGGFRYLHIDMREVVDA